MSKAADVFILLQFLPPFKEASSTLDHLLDGSGFRGPELPCSFDSIFDGTDALIRGSIFPPIRRRADSHKTFFARAISPSNSG